MPSRDAFPFIQGCCEPWITVNYIQASFFFSSRLLDHLVEPLNMLKRSNPVAWVVRWLVGESRNDVKLEHLRVVWPRSKRSHSCGCLNGPVKFLLTKPYHLGATVSANKLNPLVREERICNLTGSLADTIMYGQGWSTLFQNSRCYRVTIPGRL